MPVLDPERQTPRSAVRYRPIHTDQAGPAPVTSRARRSRSDARVTAAPVVPDDGDLEEEQQRPRRRSVAPVPHARTRRRLSPLFFIGLGLVVAILLWIGITRLVSWGGHEINLLKYGDPPTFQIDAVVGQGDNSRHPSHFLAINLHGIVTIIEFPAGDPSRARVVASTNVLGPNADQAVATLRFVDVNQNGKPDMVITIDGIQTVLVNDGSSSFRSPTPAEQQQIQNALQQGQ